MKIIAAIFARGNSKGIKNKNLLNFKNTSLLGHAIKQAHKIKMIDSVYVSSDSKKIINEAIKNKAIVPFIRPRSLALDNSPEIFSWRHFAKYLLKNNIKCDYIVSVPTTSPLRKISDISRCISLAAKNNFDIVFSISRTNKNPFFNILVKKNKKLKILSNRKNLYFRRQDAPECYNLTTVCYVFKPAYILKKLDLFSGNVGYVEIPKERAIDIDDKFDYEITKIVSKNVK
jgi:N-acylneuraminate cytidylyltransferase